MQQVQIEPQSHAGETSREYPGLKAVIVAAVIAIVAAVLSHFGAPNWLSLGIVGAIAAGIIAGMIAAAIDASDRCPWWLWLATPIAITIGYGIVISFPCRWWDSLIGGIVAVVAAYFTASELSPGDIGTTEDSDC